MSTTAPANPYMAAVTVPDGSTAVNLLALLQDADEDAPTKCAGLKIAANLSIGGYLYIGNSDVSTTQWGQQLTAGQYYQEPMHNANDMPLKDIWLVTDSAGDELIGITIFVL